MTTTPEVQKLDEPLTQEETIASTGSVRLRLVGLRRGRRQRAARAVGGGGPRHLGEEERAGVDAGDTG